MAELADADQNKIGLQYGLKVTYRAGSNPVLTTKKQVYKGRDYFIMKIGMWD